MEGKSYNMLHGLRWKFIGTTEKNHKAPQSGGLIFKQTS
jgi:hypothetical protein